VWVDFFVMRDCFFPGLIVLWRFYFFWSVKAVPFSGSRHFIPSDVSSGVVSEVIFPFPAIQMTPLVLSSFSANGVCPLLSQSRFHRCYLQLSRAACDFFPFPSFPSFPSNPFVIV